MQGRPPGRATPAAVLCPWGLSERAGSLAPGVLAPAGTRLSPGHGCGRETCSQGLAGGGGTGVQRPHGGGDSGWQRLASERQVRTGELRVCAGGMEGGQGWTGQGWTGDKAGRDKAGRRPGSRGVPPNRWQASHAAPEELGGRGLQSPQWEVAGGAEDEVTVQRTVAEALAAEWLTGRPAERLSGGSLGPQAPEVGGPDPGGPLSIRTDWSWGPLPTRGSGCCPRIVGISGRSAV